VTAVSSYRPLGRFSDIDHNQIIAKHSWDSVFDGIIYLNPWAKQLDSMKTVFTGTMRRPRMMELFLTAAVAGGIAVVINSDIVIGQGARTELRKVFTSGSACAYSFRYEFDPRTLNLNSAKQVDSGLDFFAAHSLVWYKTFNECPDKYVIGNPEWDSWLLTHWQKRYGRHCVNITNWKLVFHPNHGNREREPDVVGIDRTHAPA